MDKNVETKPANTQVEETDNPFEAAAKTKRKKSANAAGKVKTESLNPPTENTEEEAQPAVSAPVQEAAPQPTVTAPVQEAAPQEAAQPVVPETLPVAPAAPAVTQAPQAVQPPYNDNRNDNYNDNYNDQYNGNDNYHSTPEQRAARAMFDDEAGQRYVSYTSVYQEPRSAFFQCKLQPSLKSRLQKDMKNKKFKSINDLIHRLLEAYCAEEDRREAEERRRREELRRGR